MPTTNARKHTIPAPADQSITRATIFNVFGNSIRDVVPVATATERGQLVSALTTAGEAPSATKPLVVLRADAPGLHRMEYTTNGTVWIPTTGVLQFASKAAADSFGTSNGGLLTVGDEARVGSAVYRWSGTAWRSANRTAVFTISANGFGDATLASTGFTTAPKDDETTDSSFISARTGTSLTVAAGLYLTTVHFELAGATFSGRTFAEIAVNGVIHARNNSQHGVSENAGSVTAMTPVMTDGSSLIARIFKVSGGNANLTGRMAVTKLA